SLQREVHHHQIWPEAADCLQSPAGSARLAAHLQVWFVVDDFRKTFPDDRVIIDEQDSALLALGFPRSLDCHVKWTLVRRVSGRGKEQVTMVPPRAPAQKCRVAPMRRARYCMIFNPAPVAPGRRGNGLPSFVTARTILPLL